MKMFRIPMIPVAAAVLLLAGCADPPSLTDSTNARNADVPTVSLCYSGKSTTREELATMALGFCPDGTGRVEYWDHDTFGNNCPISKKNRVTYRCLAF